MILLTQIPKDQLVEQLMNGVTLMLLGMGTVLMFLVVLIFITKGMSSIVKKIEAKKPQVAPTTATRGASQNAAAPNTSDDAEIAAAIVAAVSKSRE